MTPKSPNTHGPPGILQKLPRLRREVVGSYFCCVCDWPQDLHSLAIIP